MAHFFYGTLIRWQAQRAKGTVELDGSKCLMPIDAFCFAKECRVKAGARLAFQIDPKYNTIFDAQIVGFTYSFNSEQEIDRFDDDLPSDFSLIISAIFAAVFFAMITFLYPPSILILLGTASVIMFIQLLYERWSWERNQSPLCSFNPPVFLTLSLLGAWSGALLGQYMFNYQRRQPRFKYLLWLVSGINFSVLFLLGINFDMRPPEPEPAAIVQTHQPSSLTEQNTAPTDTAPQKPVTNTVSNQAEPSSTDISQNSLPTATAPDISLPAVSFFETPKVTPPESCYIVVQDFRDMEAAKTFAAEQALNNPDAPIRIFFTQKYKFAVTNGTLEISSAAAQLDQKIAVGELPPESYCLLKAGVREEVAR